MKLSDFDYDLPVRCIAQSPAVPRDSSKLMVVDRKTAEISHHRFRDLPNLLTANDVLVVNDSEVIPARLFGKKVSGEAEIEVLLLKEVAEGTWESLVRPGKRLKAGSRVQFSRSAYADVLTCDRERGIFVLQFVLGDISWKKFLSRYGHMPIPPYITKNLGQATQYQTVFHKHTGSVAAPTAGLHFTSRLIQKLKHQGIQWETVTLHVGLGTFQPVKTDVLEQHVMHAERFTLSKETAERLNRARKSGRRIISVGTTTTRVLETCYRRGAFIPQSAETKLFITPGYRFRAIDGLITNFHLPKSTLLVLVSSFAGRDLTMKSYETAKKRHYRFYSFGDAMLIR